MKNPFNITKAVDYTDKELNEFWVDFPGMGFEETIKPTSDMPMIILGSKGSGKTHIMKHFSFKMQSLRHDTNLLDGIIKDGYIGTYLRCSGLNGYKFSGRGEDEGIWGTFFAYYLELWLGQLILNNICKFIASADISVNEKYIIEKILSLFDTAPIPLQKVSNLEDLTKYLSQLQKGIDYSINNRAFTKKSISESVEVLLSPGSLIFGIPTILSEEVKEFNGLKFLYLLDEYENFTESQQKYFNTLIRERKNPTCFKIGSRRYGFRTKSTLSAGEEIKVGSEYEDLDIDSIFRERQSNYREFILEICNKRLKHSGVDIDKEHFKDYFEEFNEEKFYNDIRKKESRHLIKLFNNLKHSVYQKDSKKIILNLRFDSDILLERTNIMLLYRAWKDGRNLVDESLSIKKACVLFYKGIDKDNSHGKVLSKYKNDLLDSLARDNGLKIETYIGFNNLIKISNGIPRHFLIMMKHIYRWSEFYDMSIFKSGDNKISSLSQLNAINDTATWFIEDARIPGNNGHKIKDCIERLCDYLRELRFSNLPPECSISSFSIDSRVIPNEIKAIIDFLEQYSYLIKVGGRRDKNHNSRNQTFQINGLLAAEWELSLARRGIVNLNSTELSAIFLPKDDSDYKNIRSQSLAKYNVPFTTESTSPSLFD